ncbi:MAG: rod shape-determining protein MreD [Lactobacillus sp.]|nr:rod shape-determining protein MreD [Lactobacillus sp.]
MRVMKKWWPLVAAIVAIFLDGIYAKALSGIIVTGFWQAPVMGLPIFILLISIFDDMNFNNVWLALAVGIIADSYFWGVFGIYAVALPLAVVYGRYLSRILPENFLVRWIIVIIGTSLIIVYIWLIFNFTKMAQLTLGQLALHLLGNLFLTTFIFAIYYNPTRALVENYPFFEDLDRYSLH